MAKVIAETLDTFPECVELMNHRRGNSSVTFDGLISVNSDHFVSTESSHQTNGNNGNNDNNNNNKANFAKALSLSSVDEPEMSGFSSKSKISDVSSNSKESSMMSSSQANRSRIGSNNNNINRQNTETRLLKKESSGANYAINERYATSFDIMDESVINEKLHKKFHKNHKFYRSIKTILELKHSPSEVRLNTIDRALVTSIRHSVVYRPSRISVVNRNMNSIDEHDEYDEYDENKEQNNDNKNNNDNNNNDNNNSNQHVKDNSIFSIPQYDKNENKMDSENMNQRATPGAALIGKHEVELNSVVDHDDSEMDKIRRYGYSAVEQHGGGITLTEQTSILSQMQSDQSNLTLLKQNSEKLSRIQDGNDQDASRTDNTGTPEKTPSVPTKNFVD